MKKEESAPSETSEASHGGQNEMRVQGEENGKPHSTWSGKTLLKNKKETKYS